MAYGTYKPYEKAFQPHPSGKGWGWGSNMAHIGSPPTIPPKGGRLIWLIRLIGLIGHIWLMRGSFGAPLPWGGAGGGLVIWPILVGNMAHIGR